MAAKRECVRQLQAKGLSERQACRLVAISTSVLGQCAHEHNDHFTDIHPKTNWRSQIEHARKIGIGNVDYELVTVK